MRVLLASSLRASGHPTPIVSVAWTLRRSGHETIVLVPPSLSEEIAGTGLGYMIGDEPTRRASRTPRSRSRWLRSGGACSTCSAIDERHPGIAQAIRAAPYLTPFPASLDTSPRPDTRRFRHPSVAGGAVCGRAVPGGALPDWWPAEGAPRVYMTSGTVIGRLSEARGVYRTALAAVADLPIRVLLSVGRATDPGSLGAVPANTHVEPWVAQHDVMPHTALVVCHGGSGTTFGALGAGVPAPSGTDRG